MFYHKSTHRIIKKDKFGSKSWNFSHYLVDCNDGLLSILYYDIVAHVAPSRMARIGRFMVQMAAWKPRKSVNRINTHLVLVPFPRDSSDNSPNLKYGSSSSNGTLREEIKFLKKRCVFDPNLRKVRSPTSLLRGHYPLQDTTHHE